MTSVTSPKPERRFKIVVLGLSITSSWGNGHATTYRGLLRGLHELGHDVLFLERDVPWYADNRDLPQPAFARVELYDTLSELQGRHAEDVRTADLVIVGSYVPDGIAIGRWVTRTAQGLSAFYDIDTPITLAMLAEGRDEYVSKALIPHYGLYLSFTGGPALEILERQYGSPRARALYCAADTTVYRHDPHEPAWDLAYMGTYSLDRQPTLQTLLLDAAGAWPAGKFAVMGPQYPDEIDWPSNVERDPHLSPDRHSAFYNRQRFTLNVTRARMRELGYSPSVRLFEAAACGTPIISDHWAGIETVFEPGREILLARSACDTLELLRDLPDVERRAIGLRARQCVLSRHTARHRAQELLDHLGEATNRTSEAP
jgi:spore maturation protein CgeB